MKVPVLKNVYRLQELITSNVGIKCKLLRTSKGNVALANELVPHLEYTLIRLSDSSTDTIALSLFKSEGIVKVKINDSTLESVLRRNVAVINEPITLHNLRNVHVCVSDECIDLGDAQFMSIINFLNELVLSVKRNNTYIVANINGIKKVVKSVIGGSEILACQATLSTKDSLVISVWDRFEGVGNEFKVSCNDITDLICNKNLCVVSCGRTSWVVSLNDIYPLPIKLWPLIRCGNEDYLYDPKHKLIVKSVHGELSPLTIMKYPSDIDCLDNSKLLVSLGDELSIVEGNLRKALIRGYMGDLSAKGTTAIFNSGSSYRVISDDELTDVVIKSSQCVLVREGIAICTVGNDMLGLLDISKPIKPEIDVLSSTVSSNSYVRVRVKPWFTTSELIIDDRLVLVESNVCGDSLEILLRPKILGWSSDIRLYVKDPLFTITKTFPISSSTPKLINANVVRTIYIDEGGVVTPYADFVALLNIELSNEVPENAILKTSVEGLRVSSINDVIIGKGHTNAELMIVGNVVNKDIVKINLGIQYDFLKDEYYIGSVTLRPKEYITRNPLKKSIKVLRKQDRELEISVGLNESSIHIVCSNGYELKSSSNKVIIDLNRCKSPILITVTYNDLFNIYLTKIIEDEQPIQVREGDEFAIENIDGNITLYVPRLSYELFKDLDIVSGGTNVRLKLKMKELNVPAVLIWVCGDDTSYKYIPPKSREVLLECSSSNFLKGLQLYVLTPGMKLNEAPRKYFSIKEMVIKSLEYAVRNATTISKLVGINHD